MSDYNVSGLPSDGRITINTLDTNFYYFPSGANTSCTNLIVTVTGSGSAVTIGSPSYSSVFDFPVTLDISLDTTVNFVGELDFKQGLTIDFDGLPSTGPLALRSPRRLPLVNFGTGSNALNGTFYAPTGPLITFIRSANIYFRNNDTIVYMHLNPAVNSGNGCVATYNNKFNVDPNVTNTLLYYIIDQEMIDNAEGALFPNSFWATGPAYNMIFTGTTDTSDGDIGICPWSLDPAYMPSVSMDVFINNNVTFDFTQYVYDEEGNESISTGYMPQTLHVDVSSGYILTVKNIILEASPNDQAFKLYGSGIAHFSTDSETDAPLVTLISDNSGYVYIDYNSGDYGSITGHAGVALVPGVQRPDPNTEDYGVDPTYAYEQFDFELTQSGTYEFTDFSEYPVNLTIGATPVTISGSSFGQGMNITFGATVDHSVTMTLDNTYVGGPTVNIDGPAPADTDGNLYLIYSTDPEYATLIVNPNSTLEITTSMNFILPSITVSGSGATYKINALPDNVGSYIFNSTIEHDVVFAPTVVQLNTCGSYILAIDDLEFKVKSVVDDTVISDSTVHSSLSVNGTDHSVTTRGNVYYSTDNTFSSPLSILGTVTMSSSNPDTWYMSASDTYPYSGTFASDSQQYGTIYLGNGSGGSYNMSNSSWYGMNSVILTDNGGSYILNNITTGHGSNMELTGNSGSSNLQLNSSAGVTLIANSGYTYNLNTSDVASGTQDGAIILSGNGGTVDIGSTTSTFTAQHGKAIVFDTTDGDVTLTYSTDPILRYQADLSAYNFGAANTIHTMEYDVGIYLYDPLNAYNFTFNGFDASIMITGDSTLAATPIITGSTFNHGVDLHTLSSSQITVSGSDFYYTQPETVILMSGAGTVYLNPTNNLHHECESLDRFFQVGYTEGGDSCTLISRDALNIINEEGYSWDYGVTAYTTGNINLGPIVFRTDPAASHTTVRWYNLYEGSGQPFLSNQRYIAYSYDPVSTVGFERYESYFELNGNNLSSYPFAICSGDPSLNGDSAPQLTTTLRVVSSDLITSDDRATLNEVFNDWTDNYYGAFDGSDVQNNTGVINGNALISYTLDLNAAALYLGGLTVDTSFVESDFSNNGHNRYGVTPIAPFVYSINDHVNIPNLTVTDYEDEDEETNYYVPLSTGNIARILYTLDTGCVLPVYIMPYTGTVNDSVTVDDIRYAGYVTTREYIEYQSRANDEVYLSYDEYINAGANSGTVQYIDAGDTAKNFMITSISGEEYFSYAVLPFYGYFCRDPTQTTVYLASNSARTEPSSYSHILVIHNEEVGQYPYPMISDTGSGFYTTDSVTLNTNEDGSQVGTFTKNSVYNSSTVGYTYDFWFKATVDTSGGGDHIYQLAGNTDNFSYTFSTTDPSVNLTDHSDSTATVRVHGRDEDGHRIGVSIVTNNGMSAYDFNEALIPSIEMTETAELFTLGTLTEDGVVTVNTNVTLPPVILVGFGDLDDNALNSMEYSGAISHNYNRESDPSQYLTVKTVGSIADGEELNFRIGFSSSDAAMADAVDSNSASQTITMTSDDGHSKTYEFDVSQLSETDKILNDGMTFTVTPDDENTTYNGITLNGNGAGQAAYQLITISAAEFVLATDDFRNIQFAYSVGPYETIPDSSINNYSDPDDATDWTVASSVNIYPTSRIYDIGFNVNLNSSPYYRTDATNATVYVDLSFNDGSGHGLTIGEGGFNVYSDASFATLSDDTLELNNSNWSGGLNFYINAPDCSIAGVTPQTINVLYKVRATDTDYSDMDSNWHLLCVVDYSGLPTGEVAALKFNLGNWVIQSDANGNLLFQYSVLRVDGTNDILGTYRLVPLSTNKQISAVTL